MKWPGRRWLIFMVAATLFAGIVAAVVFGDDIIDNLSEGAAEPAEKSNKIEFDGVFGEKTRK